MNRNILNFLWLGFFLHLFVFTISVIGANTLNSRIPSPKAVSKLKLPAIITEQSKEDTISLNDYNRFSPEMSIPCQATGYPPPTYFWTKDGKVLEIGGFKNKMYMKRGRGALYILSPDEEDIGRYQCFAQNEYGKSMSKAVKLMRHNVYFGSVFNPNIPFYYSNESKILMAREGRPFQLRCLENIQRRESWVDETVGQVELGQDQFVQNGTKQIPRFVLDNVNDQRTSIGPDGTIYFSNLALQDNNTYQFCANRGDPVGEIFKIFVEPKDRRIQQLYVSHKFQVGVEGQPAQLFCVYGGAPSLKVKWKKMGSEKTYTEGNSLTINPVQNGGLYTCEFNYGGQNVSHEFRMLMLIPPWIGRATGKKEGSSSLEIMTGAYGYPDPDLEWTFNGQPLEDAGFKKILHGRHNITIKGSEEQLKGVFGLNASNIIGYIYAEFQFIDELKTTIYRMPFEILLKEGRVSTFTLECRHQTDLVPEYIWKKDGEVFNWRSKLHHVEKSTIQGSLTIFKPEEADSGHYQCFGKTKFGLSMFSEMILRVLKQKDVPVQNISAAEGFPLKLQCDEKHPKENIIWVRYFIGREILPIRDQDLVATPDGTIWFPYLTLEHASDDFVYACAEITQNPVGANYAGPIESEDYVVISKFSLKVIPEDPKPVKQYVTNGSITEIRGNPLSLFCIYGGKPVPKVRWFFNNEEIKNATGRVNFGHFGKKLTISSVDYGDAGKYMCKVASMAEDIFHTFDVTVYGAPKITKSPKSVNATIGGTVHFECSFSGKPDASITWSFNAGLLLRQPELGKNVAGRSKIVIRNLTKRDEGVYGCSAHNYVGYDYEEAYLNVVDG